MDKLIVRGGNRLVGTVKTSGAKNAVLPIIAASILGETPSHLDEIPKLEDVRTICGVLRYLGVKIDDSREHELTLDTSRMKPLMNWSVPCGLRLWCWDRCWPVWGMPVFPSRAVARLAAGPSICI